MVSLSLYDFLLQKSHSLTMLQAILNTRMMQYVMD